MYLKPIPPTCLKAGPSTVTLPTGVVGTWCPFPNPRPGTCQALFNSRMSSVREAVEWGFGRLKTLWPFASSPSKIKVRQAPVGKIFLVAVLLTNVHCCLQPLGNQISMYFDLPPPTLDEYLGLV